MNDATAFHSRSARLCHAVRQPWVLVTTCLAVLLAQVDTAVVNLAVHSIGNLLGAAVSGLQWVLDAYNLACALLLLTGGLLVDLYGRRRLFVIGAAIFTGGSFIVAEGEPTIAVLAFAGAATAFTLFLLTERRHGQAAMVALDLFRHRAFGGALAATAGMTFGMYGVLFLVPLIWQSNGVLAASAAGLALVPMAAVFFVLSNITGRLTEYVGARAMIADGTALIGIGLWVIRATTAGRPLWLAEIGLILTGLGMGLDTGPLFGVAVGAVSRERSGSAGSLINVAGGCDPRCRGARHGADGRRRW